MKDEDLRGPLGGPGYDRRDDYMKDEDLRGPSGGPRYSRRDEYASAEDVRGPSGGPGYSKREDYVREVNFRDLSRGLGEEIEKQMRVPEWLVEPSRERSVKGQIGRLSRSVQSERELHRLLMKELEIGVGNEGLTAAHRQACEYWLRNRRRLLSGSMETGIKMLSQLTELNRIGERIQYVEAQQEALLAARKELSEKARMLWIQKGESMCDSNRRTLDRMRVMEEVDETDSDDWENDAGVYRKGVMRGPLSGIQTMTREEAETCGYKTFCRWCNMVGKEYKSSLDRQLEEKCQSFLRTRNVAQHVFDLLGKIPIPRWMRMETAGKLGFQPIDFDALGRSAGMVKRVDCVQFFDSLYAAAHTANMSPMRILAEIRGGTVFKGELAEEVRWRMASGDFEMDIDRNRRAEDTPETDVVAWGYALYQFSILFTEAFGVKMDPAVLMMEIDRFELSDESPQAFEKSLMELRYLITQAGVTEPERELYHKFKVKTIDMPRVGKRVADEVESIIQIKQCMGVRNVQYDRNFLVSTVAQIVPRIVDQDSLNSKNEKVVRSHGVYAGRAAPEKCERRIDGLDRSTRPWKFLKCETCGFKHYMNRFCPFRDDRKKDDGTYMKCAEFNGYKPWRFAKFEAKTLEKIFEVMKQNSKAWQELGDVLKRKFVQMVADAKEEQVKSMRNVLHHVRTVGEPTKEMVEETRGLETVKSEDGNQQVSNRKVSGAHTMTSPAQHDDKKIRMDTLTWWCGEAIVRGETIPMAIHVDGGSEGAFMHEGLAEEMGLEVHEYPRDQQYLVMGATGQGRCPERVTKYVYLCMRIDGVEYYGEMLGDIIEV